MKNSPAKDCKNHAHYLLIRSWGRIDRFLKSCNSDLAMKPSTFTCRRLLNLTLKYYDFTKLVNLITYRLA